MEYTDIRSLIINVIKQDGNKKIPIGIIVKKIHEIDKKIKKDKIFPVIYKMIDDGELVRIFENKVVLGHLNYEMDMSKTYSGILSINSAGDGFIKSIVNDQEVEFYVYRKNLLNALRNDEVEFVKLKKDKNENELEEVAITNILKRSKQSLVVTANLNEKFEFEFIPDDLKFYLKIVLDGEHNFKNGDKLLLKIVDYKNDIAIAKLDKIIGNVNDVGTDVMSILYENGVPMHFSDETIKLSNELKFKITDFDNKYRRDIRDRMIISIDPETSKDLDDAIYVKKLDNGNYFLGVSIADVSSYVQINTSIDEDAILRGTSVYYLNKVIPMLPFNISDHLCSLNQDEEKMCLTCDMEFDKQGNILSYNVFPAIMQNKCRMSYDEVNDFYNKNIKRNGVLEEIYDQLLISKELHEILRTKNITNGYIDFEIKEPKIILDKDGIPIDIQIKKSGIAQKMIEDFMISANQCVTMFANDLEIPFVYRIHDKPEFKKYENFIIESKKLNFKILFDYHTLTPRKVYETLEANKDNENINILRKLMLRLMQKAKYSTQNIGHFGLALQDYTHFTSPIRRYSDLLIHRILWYFVFAKDYYSDEERQVLRNKINDLIDQCNLTEIRQVNSERDINSFKFAEYMSYRIGEEYEGVISAVVSFGIFVELDNTIEGLISIKNLDDDFYTYIPENLTLVGRKNNRVFTIGQKVKIRVISANKMTRKIDFKLIKIC
ncbi:MAG: ribonuclease R [Candidatus Ureaplasma intestinipullorum]|uniref:Ribonuclease R n=1 Tax=Candidatus Ureaplasma intestinipullorum TaxID=2838770 RepID=A0A9E2NVX8_9BACT|nr:ribonuclease R [Candidatus Ureaplasma intestinipullorum]